MNTTARLFPSSRLPSVRETTIVLSLWILTTTVVFMDYPLSEFLTSWCFTIPGGWLMYQTSLRWVFPTALGFRFPFMFYAGCILLYCIIFFFATCITFAVYVENEDFFISMAGITFFTLFFILAPAQWFIFKRFSRNNEELFTLRKELGQTEASIDLLRSQINPHFLFNALNTLYGMAILEKANRTSEAIEKLGSMMRFMLQENMRTKIPLFKDLEYLHNYTSLQRLRTDTNPNIKIQIAIQKEIDPTLQIAPMLLIPFIENAFKHGISLREESHIRVLLNIKGNTLYFDVFNIKHLRSENRTEKNYNGIGMTNVTQRLKMLYPGKHKLVINETTSDFSVHLVIKL